MKNADARTLSLLQRGILAGVVGAITLAATIAAFAWAFFRLEGGESEHPALILAIATPLVTPLLLRPFLPRGWSPLGTGLGGVLGLAVWWGLAWAYLGPRYGPKPITFALVFPLTALGAFAASRPRLPAAGQSRSNSGP